MSQGRVDRHFLLLFVVMLAIAAGNTALQSVLPALGRSLHVADNVVAAVFSVSALLWVVAAPFWANRSDRRGRKAMVLVGVAGFSASQLLCGLFLAAGINGWISAGAAFGAFVGGRMLYGAFGSAAPPAVQALVAGQTTRAERTRALALIGSAFGLGTIFGPAIAPWLVMGHVWNGGPEIGLAGPCFAFSVAAALLGIAVLRILPSDAQESDAHGAVVSYPTIGGQGTGASVIAAVSDPSPDVGYLDPRVRVWLAVGLVLGHAQAMTTQAIGFLVIDRLHLAPADAIQPTGLVLMVGAGASLLAQWGLIPLLDLKPRALVLSGSLLGAAGLMATGSALSFYGIITGFALASLGIGLMRPGFTAGASLAVDAHHQGSVAGKVTSINGVAYVAGPSLGVGLYEVWRPLPYLAAAAALVLLFLYAVLSLRSSHREPGAFPVR